MADPSELLRAKLGNPSSSNPSSRALGVREEGEVSSGGEDESVLGRAINLEPSNLSLMSNAEKSTKIGAIASSSNPNPNPNPIPVTSPSINLQRPMPQTIPHAYHGNSYNKRILHSKPPNNRNLSWQKKRPLDDHNLVISFSDDESENDTTPAHVLLPVPVPVRPQMPRPVGRNASAQQLSRAPLSRSNGGALGISGDKVLETLRHEIALREKSLKTQKVGPTEATDGRPSKRTKVEPPPSNGNNHNSSKEYAKGDSNQSLSRQNGDDENKNVSVGGGGGIVLSKANNNNNNSRENNGGLVLESDTSAWLNQNAENSDGQAQLQLLLEQEDAQDRELEQAQELRRRLESEEREALKAYRKAQRALFEANEKCNLLQKKRDLMSSRVNNSLLENSSTSNMPWPLCWHDPREESPSDQPTGGACIAVSRNDNREEGQLTDSTNTKDQVEEAALSSDVDKRGSPSGNSSPQQDYEALEASLRSELVARYRNKAPLNSTKSAEKDYTESRENHSPSPDETKDYNTELAHDRMVNEENISPSSPKGSLELPLSTSVSFSECNQTSLKITTVQPAVNEPGEKITHASHFVLPNSAVRNACVHIKQLVIISKASNARYEGMDIVKEPEERTREDTDVRGPQVDPFWPFCIFELRGRCNDEECCWQHAKDYDRRNFKPHTSLTSPSGHSQHAVHVPTYQIGSYLIKAGPYLAGWQRGFCASFPVPALVQRLLPLDAPCLSFPEAPVAHQYNEIGSCSLKLFLEEDLPEADKCLALALNSSLGKQKVLLMLSRALERDPKSVLIWIVYLHIYYTKEKNLGKDDDMFLDAVHNNKYSYDLWLIYINSRLKLEDQLNAFENALTTMCQLGPTISDEEKKDQSSIILDLYLHMVDTLCMSGNTETAISRVFKFSSDELLTTVRSSLVAPDKCIFWITSIYLSVYGKLPQGILEQFELEKELNFAIDWPSVVSLRTDEEIIRVLGLFKHAFIDFGLVETDLNSPKTEGKYLKELHFLAISHVKCMAAVQGVNDATTGLLVKYKEIYPNCVELALMLARLGRRNATCQVAISDWPRQFLGFQCMWNQYAEHFLASKRFDLARDLLSCWFGDTNLETFIDFNPQEQLFGLLNLSLYQLMQDDLPAAHLTVNKALKLADQEFYKHCLREHVAVHLLKESLIDHQRDISSRVVLDLIGSYLQDARARPVRKLLSRKFYRDIKKITARELLDEWLGPVSDDYSSINSILEVCYGESLIPEKSGIKELVNLVESVTQISPANYRFAISVCRFVVRDFGFDDVDSMGVRFWTGSVLVNSIFQSVPVAPEPVWVETAELLINLKLFEISIRFLEQAVLVYPLSLKLWQSYLSLSKTMNEKNSDRIIETAKERGIELSS